jgi:hypothetical protein
MGSAREAARYRIESTGKSSPASSVDMAGWVRFARQAEESGIDSVLISFSRYEPDPLLAACAVGRQTEKVKYIVAFRSCRVALFPVLPAGNRPPGPPGRSRLHGLMPD